MNVQCFSSLSSKKKFFLSFWGILLEGKFGVKTVLVGQVQPIIKMIITIKVRAIKMTDIRLY